jgi:hypothetical protein
MGSEGERFSGTARVHAMLHALHAPAAHGRPAARAPPGAAPCGSDAPPTPRGAGPAAGRAARPRFPAIARARTFAAAHRRHCARTSQD